MKLVEKFNTLGQGLMEKAAKLMSDRYTDNEKAGIGLAMALDAKDGIEDFLDVIDRLDEQNQKLLAQNRDLLEKLAEIQKDVNDGTMLLSSRIECMKYANKYNGKKGS